MEIKTRFEIIDSWYDNIPANKRDIMGKEKWVRNKPRLR